MVVVVVVVVCECVCVLFGICRRLARPDYDPLAWRQIAYRIWMNQWHAICVLNMVVCALYVIGRLVVRWVFGAMSDEETRVLSLNMCVALLFLSLPVLLPLARLPALLNLVMPSCPSILSLCAVVDSSHICVVVWAAG